MGKRTAPMASARFHGARGGIDSRCHFLLHLGRHGRTDERLLCPDDSHVGMVALSGGVWGNPIFWRECARVRAPWHRGTGSIFELAESARSRPAAEEESVYPSD